MSVWASRETTIKALSKVTQTRERNYAINPRKQAKEREEKRLKKLEKLYEKQYWTIPEIVIQYSFINSDTTTVEFNCLGTKFILKNISNQMAEMYQMSYATIQTTGYVDDHHDYQYTMLTFASDLIKDIKNNHQCKSTCVTKRVYNCTTMCRHHIWCKDPECDCSFMDFLIDPSDTPCECDSYGHIETFHDVYYIRYNNKIVYSFVHYPDYYYDLNNRIVYEPFDYSYSYYRITSSTEEFPRTNLVMKIHKCAINTICRKYNLYSALNDKIFSYV